MSDRRSGAERRKHPRIKVNYAIEWENHSGLRAGTMSDVSVGGCFILGPGHVANGETIHVYLPLTSGNKAKFTAEVRDVIYDIGFAVKFVELSAVQSEFLERFVEANTTN